MSIPFDSVGVAGDPSLLGRIAWSVRWQDRSKSVDYAIAALENAELSGLPNAQAVRGRAHLTMAWQARWRGDFDEGMTHALEVERFLDEPEFPAERAHAYGALGVLHYSRGRLDLATTAVDRGFTLIDPDTDPSAFVELLITRASILKHRGDSNRAGLVLRRAEDVAERDEQARVQHNIARWLLDDGHADKAMGRAEIANELAQKTRCRVIEPYTLEVLAEVKGRLGEFEAAETDFKVALSIAREDEDRRVECQLLRAYGAMERARGNHVEALALSREGARLAAEMNYLIWQQRFARECASLFEERGDLKAALNQHKAAWALADKRRN